jgi:pimeloyl-[acyl-carrier protein] methyl ester esterase
VAALTALLLPGLDGTGDLFAPFVAAAPEEIYPIVVSYPTAEASIEALERHVREKITEKCIVIAESFSGPIGVRVASDARVRALILCNSFIRSPLPRALRFFAISPIFAIPMPRLAVRRHLLGHSANSELVEIAQAVLRRVPARVLAQRTRHVFETDERKAVRDLPKPILYLRGADDTLCSESSWEELHAIRPDAEIAKLRGPHLLLQVSPAECWQAILRFMETGSKELS